MRLAVGSCALLGMVGKAGVQNNGGETAFGVVNLPRMHDDSTRRDATSAIGRLHAVGKARDATLSESIGSGTNETAAAPPFHQKFRQWIQAAPSEEEAVRREQLTTEVIGRNARETESEKMSASPRSADHAPTMKEKRRRIDEIHLSYDENQKLHALFSNLDQGGSEHRTQSIASISRMVEQSLSEPKFSKIKNFPDADDFALLVRNLPSDRALPPTPDGNTPPASNVSVITASILGVFGTMKISPVGYQGEDDRSFFRHVAPRKLFVDRPSSYGANLALGMHMDNPHLPLQGESVEHLSANPEYLSLTGVRAEVDVPTRIVESRDVVARLPDFVVDELMKPNFSVKRPTSFSDERYEMTAPVLIKGTDRKIRCRFDQENVFAKTPDAALALKMFDLVAHQADLPHRVLLNKGDLLIFKNQQTLHARDSFAPRFDGTDRWIIRVFGISDLSRTIPVRPDAPHIVRA